jgi:hypothetical protein
MEFIDIISITSNQFVKRYYVTKGGKKEVVEESCSKSDYFDYIDSLKESKWIGTSTKKKTAIEWLVENSPLCKNEFWDEIIIQALKIEKQQITDAFNRGEDLGDRRNYTGEKYYKEQFDQGI